MKNNTDPIEAMRVAAAAYGGVDEGTACTQSSFKVGKKSFFFAGPQGGRFKAMFKLTSSLETARKLATEEPDRFDVGTTGWVTARFTAEEPMPEKLWKSWLDESYESALASKAGAKKAARKKK
ncbi:MAG: MmcQ/YjbR family DNA-binding protein [Planctomycetes bacterium]|nr:MmcQ/YjbR family DNA-binding protein [Planctomycetota bacterium]